MIAKAIVRWIVRKHGIWTVLDWLAEYAGDIETWAVDYWGRNNL